MRQIDFEHGGIAQNILKAALPMLVAQVLTLLYNIVDRIYIARIPDIGTAALGALGLCFPIIVIITAFSNLFGSGGAPLFAIARGSGDKARAGLILNLACTLLLCCAGVLMVIGLLFARPILVLFGASPEALQYALPYLMLYLLGTYPSMLTTGLNPFINAQGYATAGMLSVVIGAAANLVLDPLFILPQFLGLGAVGAGIATCLSNVLSVVYFLLCLVRQRNESVIGLHPRHLRHSRKYLGNILAIGFPSALQYALTVVAVAAQSRFVSQYTTEAVAALGIVKKLDQLPLYFSIGVSNGLLPLLAYHYAAGQQEKRRAAFRLGAGISLLFALVCLVLFEGFAPQLAALFIDDATTIHYAAGFLRRMVIAMPMMSLCYPLIIQFQAMGKARESLVC